MEAGDVRADVVKIESGTNEVEFVQLRQLYEGSTEAGSEIEL